MLMPRIGGDFAELLRLAAQGAMDLSARRFCRRTASASFWRPPIIREAVRRSSLSADVSLPEGCQVFWGASNVERRNE